MNTHSFYRINNTKMTLFVIALLLQGMIICSAQQISNVNQINTVRQKISPVKVSDTELRNIKSTSLKANTLTSQPSSKSLPGAVPIEVTSPANNEVWEAGKDYVIRWGGTTEDVIIELVSQGDLKPYNIVGKAPNTGSYAFKVPYNWLTNPWAYYVRVKTISGRQSGNSGSINVFTQPVDMECRIVDAYIKSDQDYYVVYSDSNAWLEFNVLMRNKGVNSPVTIENVLVRIIKEPEGVVVRQEEWGFSGIYGHEWYKLPEPRKFDINNFKIGAYRVEVELDPQNRLGENTQCRDDNKCVKLWQIK